MTVLQLRNNIRNFDWGIFFLKYTCIHHDTVSACTCGNKWRKKTFKKVMIYLQNKLKELESK